MKGTAAGKKTNFYDLAIEIISLLCLAWCFYPLLFYGELEAVRIPVHFNMAGEADGWGGRSRLWDLPVVALVIYAGLSILQRFPRIYNYPVKVTERNAGSLYRLGSHLVLYIKAVAIAIFAYINNSAVSMALGTGNGLNAVVMGALIAGLFLILAVFCIKMLMLKDR